MIEANLCTCNNCGNIFIDQNPQIGAKVFNVDETKVSDLQYLKDKDMHYWGCGVCKTDGYLTDEVDEVKAKELSIIK